MDRQEEGRLASALPADEVHGALGDEIGEIPGGMGFRLSLEEVVLPGRVAVGEVVEAAAHRAEELPVAALQRSEVRQEAEVPLADQRRRVAGVAQQRGQRRMVRRQAQHRVAAVTARDRLVVAAAQPVLEAPGHQREARGRAHRRVGVPVGEAQAVGGQAVELRGARRPATVAAEVSKAEVVGEDEDEVGPHAAAHSAVPRVHDPTEGGDRLPHQRSCRRDAAVWTTTPVPSLPMGSDRSRRRAGVCHVFVSDFAFRVMSIAEHRWRLAGRGVPPCALQPATACRQRYREERVRCNQGNGREQSPSDDRIAIGCRDLAYAPQVIGEWMAG